jgi:hypothetical protein
MTPDPYNGSSKPSNPQSWNRYNYGGNDPINNNDPTGLDEGPPTLVCTVGAGVFYGEICYGFYSSITFSSLSGYFASSDLSAAIAAAEAEAQAWLSLSTTTVQARSLLSAKLQSQTVSSNSDCMGFLETQTGKSFGQLMQDANTITVDDTTGPGGTLSIGDLGVLDRIIPLIPRPPSSLLVQQAQLPLRSAPETARDSYCSEVPTSTATSVWVAQQCPRLVRIKRAFSFMNSSTLKG